MTDLQKQLETIAREPAPKSHLYVYRMHDITRAALATVDAVSAAFAEQRHRGEPIDSVLVMANMRRSLTGSAEPLGVSGNVLVLSEEGKAQMRADIAKSAEVFTPVDPPAPSPPQYAIDAAIAQSTCSPCRSKRGVAIYRPTGDTVISSGCNFKPRGFDCDQTDACKATCRREAVHAEQMALLLAGTRADGCALVHVKTVDGALVSSGGPSCAECSKLALAAGIAGVWLYHADGWRRYDVQEFHRLSLAAYAARAGDPPAPGSTLDDVMGVTAQDIRHEPQGVIVARLQADLQANQAQLTAREREINELREKNWAQLGVITERDNTIASLRVALEASRGVAAQLEQEIAAIKDHATKHWRCPMHGAYGWEQWGCPDCVAEQRRQIATLTAERDEARAPATGERQTVSERLRQAMTAMMHLVTSRTVLCDEPACGCPTSRVFLEMARAVEAALTELAAAQALHDASTALKHSHRGADIYCDDCRVGTWCLSYRRCLAEAQGMDPHRRTALIARLRDVTDRDTAMVLHRLIAEAADALEGKG